MADFDINEYLNRKLGAPNPDKINELMRARKEKIASLNVYQNALAQNSAVALRDQAIASGRTWGEFGKDVGLSAVQGLDTVAKLPAMAYDKATTGEWFGPETQAISKMSDEREKLKSAFSQASGQVKAEAAKQAGEDFKAYTGLDGAAGTAAQVAAEFGSSFWESLKDPASIPEFVAQQIAQLGVIGKVGRATEITAAVAAKAAPALAATKAGQAALSRVGTAGAVTAGAGMQGVDVGSDTMTRLMALPDELWAKNPEFMALAEEVGTAEAKQRIASRLAEQATIQGAATSLLSAAVPGGTAIEKALLGKSMGGFKAVPKAFVGEASQEGFEEGTGKFFGNASVKEINPKQSLSEGVGAAAGQGAYMGGLMGAGIHAGQAGLGALASKSQANAAKEADKVADTADLKAAIATGDTSAYLDPKKPSYAPDKAVQVLYGHSQLADTPPEVKQANLEKASQIISDLEAQKSQVQESLDSVSPETVAKYTAALVEARQSGNPDMVTALETELASLGKEVEKAPMLEKQVARIDEQLTRAQEVLTRFNQESQAKDLDVEAEAVKLKDADPVVSAKAAEDIINLSMAIPERLDATLAMTMAADTSNSLTESQRTYLRTFSEARQAENQLMTLGTVSQDIFLGNKDRGMVGIKDYRANVTSALAAGNKAKADKELTQLGRFVDDHNQKADLMAQALATGRPYRLISNGNGGWSIEPGLWASDKERVANGGLDIVRNSKKIVAEARTEANALTTAQAELTAAYDNKFSTTPKESSNGQQAPQTEQAEAQGSQAPESDGAAAEQVADVATEEALASVVKTESAEVVESTESVEGPLQSTEEGTTDAAEAVEAVPEAAPAETVVEVAGLTALQNKSAEGTAFNQRNLLADFFKQSKGSDIDESIRPLAAVKDFMSQGTEAAKAFLKDKVLSVKQQAVLQLFRDKANAWQGNIRTNLAERNPAFRFEDLVQFFLTKESGKLDVDENVKTAISYAVFSWVAETAARPEYNTDEQINAILDRDESHPVSKKEREALGNVGTRENVVRNVLGQRIVQALGLKATQDAPVNLQPDLEAALGAHAWKLMMDLGLVARTTLSGADMAELTKSTATVENAQFHFIKLARDNAGNLNKEANDIVDASIGSQGVLDKLFSVESGLKEPSLEPIPFTQTRTRNTNQKVPEKLAKIIEHENSVANYVRQDMVQLITQLGEDVLHSIAGVVDVSESKDHVTNRASLTAKNDGLIREVNRFMQFFNSMADTQAALYFDHNVWKQQRVGIATNVINPQTSKVHRFLLSRKSWDTKVSMADDAQMDNFRLRVLEGLGVKTDKQRNQKSLASYDAVVGNNLIQEAVEILRKTVFEGGITAVEQKVLADAVKQGGENFHSLDALMALAHEAQARLDGKDFFTVQMMGEIDGVTNGPMLSHLLLGAAETVSDLFGLLNRGGFYEKGNANQNYNLWRGQPGARDLYEITALHMTQGVQLLLQREPALGATLDAVYAFTGNLMLETPEILKKRRNLIKTPLTAMVFGSSVKSAVDSMADSFVESVYESIENVAAGKGDLRAVLGHINTLLVMGRGPSLRVSSIQELMETEFTPAQIKAIKKSFTDTLGKAVGNTMTADFSEFIGKRDSLNRSAQLSFDLYNAAYEGLRDAYFAELMAKGEIAVNPKTREPLHDLTAQQDAELRKRLKKLSPVMHTLMSKESKSLASGLYASKSSRKLSLKDTFKSVVKFGKSIAGTRVWSAKRNAYVEQSSVEATAYEQVESSPGVAMVVMSAHATDSAISHLAADGHEVLNVHDAHGAGLGTFQQTARNLNAATWYAMLNYSPASEMAAMLSRTLQGLAELVQEENLPPAVLANVRAVLQAAADKAETSPAPMLGYFMNTAKQVAFRADILRLGALAQMGAIDQYALEGGQYKVTDENRDEALAKIEDLNENLTAKEQGAINQINKALGLSLVPEEVVAKAEITKAFGETGESSIASEPTLVAFFNANPAPAASEVIDQLASQALSPANRKLLTLVSRTLKASNPTLTVRLITPATDPATLLALPAKASRGWYVATQEGRTEIYVLSPEFKNSGLTPELLLHELVHGAVSQAIANPTKESAALVSELGTLRALAKAYAKANGLTEFAEALSSVQELVAWGMTSEAFQQQVLAKVQMASRTTGNPLVSGMQKFIEVLVGLLGGKTNKTLQDGVTILVSNVSGLFAQAGQATASRTDQNLSMAAVDPIDQIDTFTTLQIHEALNTGAVSPSFQAHLSNLLTGMVETLHGPFGALAAQFRQTEAKTALDVWLKAKETGKAPFASAILANMAASDQEAFAIEQVEATVKAALQGNEAPAKTAYRALYDLYTEVHGKLNADGSDFFKGDWTKATPSEKAWAKSQYEFVFKIEASHGDRSDYLARFAALGLAHEGFNQLLQTPSAVNIAVKGKTFAEKLQAIVEKILAFFSEKVTHTYAGQPMDSKLATLVGQLVDIEAKQRTALKAKASGFNPLAPVEEGARQLMENTRVKIAELADSEFMKSRKNGFVAAARGLVSTAANNRVDLYLEGAQKFYEQNVASQGSVIVSLLREVQGHSKILQGLSRITKKFEGDRKDMISGQAKQARDAFATKPSKESSAAITSVFLRTGLHNLLGDFTLSEIESLIDNETAQDTAIAEYAAKLVGPMKAQYLHQIKGLAYSRATEQTKVKVLMQNAHLIARLAGTLEANKITEAQATQAEPAIKMLVSLYALKYSSVIEQGLAKEVFRTELARGAEVGNGIEFVLNTHKVLEEESLAREFKGNPALMIHGYTPDITNPHTEFKVVDEEAGRELMDYGYHQGATVPTDPADPDQTPKRFYILKGAGLAPRVSGTILFQSLKAKGSKAHNGYLNVNNTQGLENAQVQASFDVAKLGSLAKVDPNWDPRQQVGSYAAPIYNEQGRIVNWRYMMNKETRDELLQRNNRFDQVLGVHAGSTFSKEQTPAQNRKVMLALDAIYESNKATNAHEYLSVGPDSQDPELREIWSLLSDEARSDARKIFGRDGIKVKADALDLVFGYRKRSIGETFEKAKTLDGYATLNLSQRALVTSAEWVLTQYAKVKLGKSQDDAERYAKRAGAVMVQGERGWQEIMKEVKNIFVIKNIKTLAGNERSNISQLLLMGVNPMELAKHKVVAMKAATAFMADKDALDDLERQLATGYTQGKDTEIAFKIARLKDAIDRNPVKELIDGGLMPSIVEDVAEDDDAFSYKTLLAESTEGFTNKLNPKVKTAAKFMYMSRDTALYKALYRGTQLSDFTARYTLYQHLINRAEKPMSKADAMHEASEAFVNYDVPMHRNLQYLDDMGFFMFSKYFIRMQRVLLKMGRENPARALAMAAADGYLNLGPIVLDSSFIHHLGNNPISSGALQFPGALDELATVKAAMALIK